MPCCGGKDAGKPITATRYAIGLFMMLGTHIAIFFAVAALALFVPRYRRLLGPYVFYFRRTFRSVLSKERILVGSGAAGRCVPPTAP